MYDLFLESNHLTGTIPTEIGLMVATRHWIDVSTNELTGTVPTEIGKQ
jgi:hypothetical protein